MLVSFVTGCASAQPAAQPEPPAVVEIAPEPVVGAPPRMEAHDPGTPPEPPAPRPSEIELRLHAIEGAGDSEWDDAAIEILLEAFDRDGSKSLDSLAEIDAIPCPVFRVMDADLKGNRHAGLAVTYGFAPGYLWVGDALGFQETLRSDAYAAMERCGLGDD